LRFADRQFLALLFHEPPRRTRDDPDDRRITQRPDDGIPPAPGLHSLHTPL
jgi:hypothetical protein